MPWPEAVEQEMRGKERRSIVHVGIHNDGKALQPDTEVSSFAYTRTLSQSGNASPPVSGYPHPFAGLHNYSELWRCWERKSIPI